MRVSAYAVDVALQRGSVLVTHVDGVGLVGLMKVKGCGCVRVALSGYYVKVRSAWTWEEFLEEKICRRKNKCEQTKRPLPRQQNLLACEHDVSFAKVLTADQPPDQLQVRFVSLSMQRAMVQRSFDFIIVVSYLLGGTVSR